MNRKQRRASARPGAKAAPGGLGAPPLAEMFNAALARHRAGAFADAERQYRRIVELYPGHGDSYRLLGAALMAQAKAAEAVPFFERAVALQPAAVAAYEDLSRAHAAAGNVKLAISVAARALEIGDTPQSKALFAQCIKAARLSADDGRIRTLLTRALAEAWDRPRELTAVCISAVKLNGEVKQAIALAAAAWPRRLAADELAAAATPLAKDPLLLRLLETDTIADVGLERLLTSLRHALLAVARDGGVEAAGDDTLLGFYCALARQCFINDYVYSLTAAEQDEVRQLRERIERALADGTACPAPWVVTAAAYFPLHELAQAEALLAQGAPPCVDALLRQQIVEPNEERRIAATIPALTAIDTEVSRAVRLQYEESPYPRWVAPGPPGAPIALNDRQAQQGLDVLIAGCGTGLSTIEFARQTPKARITAIDLSLSSLSYGLRMARRFALTNIEFGQADLTNLGGFGRSFDYIDASGVLHHLADPWAGWRILLSLLRPGGVMQVGLYSALARQSVVAGRALIAERGYRATADDIRRFREEVMAAEEGSPLHALVRWNDFFATNECRDLVFHVQEHQISLPEIKAFLAANGMEFAGFVLDPGTTARFTARFPDPCAVTDLDRWHEFESAAPETFAAMYQFFIRKPS